MRDRYPGWPLLVRTLIELVPLLASLLWARRLIRWVRGMDELNRRITLEAWLFAALMTVGFLSIWPLLNAAGTSASLYPATHGFHLEGLDKPNFLLTLGVLWLSHLLGHVIINRRYQ